MHVSPDRLALSDWKIIASSYRQTMASVVRTQPEHLFDILLDIVEVCLSALLVIVIRNQHARAGLVAALRPQLEGLIARPPVTHAVHGETAVVRIRPEQAAAGHRRRSAKAAREDLERPVVQERIRNVLREQIGR